MKKFVLALSLIAMTASLAVLPLVAPAEACSDKKSGKKKSR